MALARFVDGVIHRLRETPVDLAQLAPDGAYGSLLNGAAGVSFFLYEAARMHGEADLLPLARQWCDLAVAWAARAEPVHWHGTPHGFLMGNAGIDYVDALLCAQSGDDAGAVGAVARIERRSTHLSDPLPPPMVPTEYSGGAAGVLFVARDLDARLPAGASYGPARAQLDAVRARALAIVQARYEAPLAPGAGDRLGFAHGLAGELWALVGALGAAHPLVRARLHELAALREADEDGLVYWLPWPNSDATVLLGTWCNGMPGHALLWSEVARQTGAEEWRELARQCAESVAILMNREPSICCGLAGQALALQRHAELTGDPRARRRAYARLTSAAREAELGSRFAVLWQGTLGVALVAMAWLHRSTRIALLEPAASPFAALTPTAPAP